MQFEQSLVHTTDSMASVGSYVVDWQFVLLHYAFPYKGNWSVACPRH